MRVHARAQSLKKFLLLFQVPTNMEKSLMHAMLPQKFARFFQPNHYKRFFFMGVFIFFRVNAFFKTNFKLAIFTTVLFKGTQVL